MDLHQRFHRRFFNKRQGIGGVFNFSDVLPRGSTPTITGFSSSSSSIPSQSVGDPVISILGGITPIQTSSASSSATTSSTPLTRSFSSSTGSTAATSASPAASASSISTELTAPTSTPVPIQTSPGSNVVYTSYDGTSVVYVTSTAPVASATAAPSASFLQDPSLEGGVFALVGIVALIILFVGITWTIRKRRRNRLERDLAAAVNFDPGATDLYERQEESVEKRRLSGSSSGHGHGYGHGYGMSQLAYTSPQQEFHGPVGYGQYTPPTAFPPSPNQTRYPTSSPVVPQPATQSGANLTRKFSDRKPVPPLLPDPTYDHTNTHVSIPPQFYPQ